MKKRQILLVNFVFFFVNNEFWGKEDVLEHKDLGNVPFLILLNKEVKGR